MPGGDGEGAIIAEARPASLSWIARPWRDRNGRAIGPALRNRTMNAHTQTQKPVPSMLDRQVEGADARVRRG